MRVRVYRNLHNGLWSIQHKTDKGWRLLRHAGSVWLADAVPHVQLGGWRRVYEGAPKGVHAWIEGELLPEPAVAPYGETLAVTVYRPKQHPFFQVGDKALLSARYCWLGPVTVAVAEPRCYDGGVGSDPEQVVRVAPGRYAWA